MLEVLKLIFSSFWRWLGFVILIVVTLKGLGQVLNIRIKKHVITDEYDDEDTK